jgi:hypothetical protein
MGPSEIVIIRARKGAPPVPCSLPQVYPFSVAGRGGSRARRLGRRRPSRSP